jgi:hypothetical protein
VELRWYINIWETFQVGLLLTFGRDCFAVIASSGGDEMGAFADIHLFELRAAFFNHCLNFVYQ